MTAGSAPQGGPRTGHAPVSGLKCSGPIRVRASAMRLELVPRASVSTTLRAVAPVAAFVTAFLAAGLVVWVLGRSPAAAFRVYVSDPLQDPWAIQELIV